MYLNDFIDRLDYIFSMDNEWDIFIAICRVAGIKQSDIAKKMGVSQPYISKRIKIIEKGYKKQ